MKISVITPTLGNAQLLDGMLASVVAQDWRNLEVIIVDQNEDERVAPFVSKYKDILVIKHIRQSGRGISRARNAALAHASGDLYIFIDDDGRFPKGRFRQAVQYFNENQSLSLISGPVIDPDTGVPYIKPTRADKKLSLYNLVLVNSNNIFLRAEGFRDVRFDENFGVGSGCFGAGEEPVYIYELYKRGVRGYFLKDFFNWHPAKEEVLTKEIKERICSYSIGYGAMLRQCLNSFWPKPSYWLLLFRSFIRPLGGIALSVLRRNRMRIQHYWIIWTQRANGFFFYKKLLREFGGTDSKSR